MAIEEIKIDSNLLNIWTRDFFVIIRGHAKRCYIEVYDKDTEQRIGVFEVCQVEK